MDNILARALGQEATLLTATEKQLLLSRLLARLAHEIRNPLSSLDIHVQLLEEDLAALGAPARHKLSPRLEIIHGELHRLENIVKQFLRLARPSELDLQPVELAPVVGHVCELLRPEATARGIALRVAVADPLPRLLADPAQLTQALMNLVINALQSVEQAGRVEVRAEVAADGESIQFEVRDNGPGVPLDKQGTIFEPYFTTRPEGSGLGLWIVQQIAGAHGGSIQAANAPEGGAVFTLRLPLRQEAAGG